MGQGFSVSKIPELIQRLTDRGYELKFFKTSVPSAFGQQRKVLCVEGHITFQPDGLNAYWRVIASNPEWEKPEKLETFVERSLQKADRNHHKIVTRIVELRKQGEMGNPNEWFEL